MASSLILHKRIRTTLHKARALRKYVEPLITKSKTDETHSRRVVFSYLQNKDAVRELFGEVAAAVADRPGGYTRILKLGTRRGDGAEMALIELVDFNEYLKEERKQRKARRTRRGRGGGGAAQPAETAPVVAPVAAPLLEETTPAVEDIAPVVENTAPVVEETAPVAQAHDTAAEAAEAAAEAVAPAAAAEVESQTEAVAESIPDLQVIDAEAEPLAGDDEAKPEA
jgi:large subunit ribosomal protein L17